MPQSNGTVVDNKFLAGLKTEFTGLNFPDDATIDTQNSIYTRTGLVYRRPGIDFEASHTTKTIDRSDKALSNFLWKNVSGDGTVNLHVEQIGSTLYFWDASNSTTSFPLSGSALSNTVNIASFLPASSPNDPSVVECQYASGYGFLFVFHAHLDPFYVSYNTGTQAFTAAAIDVQIRDFAGITETGISDTLNPATLTAIHRYNLGNQGWGTEGKSTTSTTGIAFTSGAKTYTVATNSATSGIVVGDFVKATDHSSIFPASVQGVVSSYSGTTLVLTVSSVYNPGGLSSGTNWVLSVAPNYIDPWFSAFANYPSNVNVWWLYKNTDDQFDPVTTLPNVNAGIKPAPKGHFILDAFNQDRTGVSGIATLTAFTPGYMRPSAGCFHQGRVFYTGVNYAGFNNQIYFSQIIENNDVRQFGKCYQENDPTDESLFDLLADDGGTIVIQGANTIVKMIPIQNGLALFADNGVWVITGSQGIGFSANDYSVQKLENIASLSASSFVDVRGMPMWWNTEGIYTVTVDANKGGLIINSLSVNTIDTFFNAIPRISRKFARGVYNKEDYIVKWVYRSTPATTMTNSYEYDSVLCLNTVTNAFYTYKISEITNGPTVNGIFVVEGSGGLTAANTVLDATTKYTCSYPSSGSYKISFAEERNTSYLDWFSFNSVGVDADAFFITGYRVYGQGNKNVNINWIDIHGVGSINSMCKMQSMWDYANNRNSNRWSNSQTVSFGTNYRDYETKRLRTRGVGTALQLKFTSIPGSPMSLIGWSTVLNVSAKP